MPAKKKRYTKKYTRKYTKKAPYEKKYSRDYDDEKYEKLRAEVRKRDQYRCQFPHCRYKSKTKLQVHHILKWSTNYYLRYEPTNCISLCPRCHKFITGKEDYYVRMFQLIILAKIKKQRDKDKDNDRDV